MFKFLVKYKNKSKRNEVNAKKIQEIKSECPLRLSQIANMWHMIKNQNFSYSSQ